MKIRVVELNIFKEVASLISCGFFLISFKFNFLIFFRVFSKMCISKHVPYSNMIGHFANWNQLRETLFAGKKVFILRCVQYFIITGQTSFKVGGHKLTPTLHPPPPKEKDPHFAAPPACPVIQGVLLRNSGWYEVNLLYMVMMVLNQSLWSLTSMWNPSLLPTTAFESITSFFTPFPLQIKRGCWYVGRIRNACLTHHYTNFPSFKMYKFPF